MALLSSTEAEWKCSTVWFSSATRRLLSDQFLIVFRQPDSFRGPIKIAHWDGWP
ncbi:hypothetical protein RBSWK_01415 [Rhodopirellula baltica SWK14]|uniref:Uncharacterized protein n=1 Tax=Rhodopirellula baltica SWK14 TaxID=993516 RepID=L7CKX1_RHOBT|nr:hypothetical protein RBSWK_01415 [Rhodopirellula baltica SWK14]